MPGFTVTLGRASFQAPKKQTKNPVENKFRIVNVVSHLLANGVLDKQSIRGDTEYYISCSSPCTKKFQHLASKLPPNTSCGKFRNK